MPKISVIIPIYNSENTIKRCLNSIIAQTLTDIEIICVNDGSKDNSLEILKKYATRDKRIKIINKKNTGTGHSSNCGLKAATGEYIGFSDHDDFMDKEMFSTLYKTAKENDADTVKANFFLDIEHDNYRNEYCNNLAGLNYNILLSPLKAKGLFLVAPSLWSGIYKRNFLFKNNIWFTETPGASYQDTAFYLKIIFCARRIVLLKEAFYHWYCDNESSGSHSKGQVYNICYEFAEIEKFAKKYPLCAKNYMPVIFYRKFFIYWWNYNRIANKYKDEFLVRMIKEFKFTYKTGILNKAYFDKDSWQSLLQLVSIKDGKELEYAIQLRSRGTHKNDGLNDTIEGIEGIKKNLQWLFLSLISSPILQKKYLEFLPESIKLIVLRFFNRISSLSPNCLTDYLYLYSVVQINAGKNVLNKYIHLSKDFGLAVEKRFITVLVNNFDWEGAYIVLDGIDKSKMDAEMLYDYACCLYQRGELECAVKFFKRAKIAGMDKESVNSYLVWIKHKIM